MIVTRLISSGYWKNHIKLVGRGLSSIRCTNFKLKQPFRTPLKQAVAGNQRGPFFRSHGRLTIIIP